MAKLAVSKESLEQKRLTNGIYEVVFNGFHPKKSKTGTVLLSPEMKIIGNADHNGKNLYDKYRLPLNSGWAVQDFVHCFGLELDADGNIPGEWDFPDQSNCETWKYRGPLVGKVGKVEIIEVQYTKKDGTPGIGVQIKQYLCAVPSCKEKNPKIVHQTSIS